MRLKTWQALLFLVLVAFGAVVWPYVVYRPGSVERLALKDGNLKIVDRYSQTLADLDDLCTEDKDQILAQVVEVAQHWQGNDPEAKYLDPLVTMKNVVGVGYIKPPNRCTQVYENLMTIDRQIHY